MVVICGIMVVREFVFLFLVFLREMYKLIEVIYCIIRYNL